MSTTTSAPGSFTIAVPVNLTQSHGPRKGVCFAQFYDHASGGAVSSNDGSLPNHGWETTGSLQRMGETKRGYSCRDGEIPGDTLQLSARQRGSLGASLPPVPNATLDRIRQRFPGIDTENYSLSTMEVPGRFHQHVNTGTNEIVPSEGAMTDVASEYLIIPFTFGAVVHGVPENTGEETHSEGKPSSEPASSQAPSGVPTLLSLAKLEFQRT